MGCTFYSCRFLIKVFPGINSPFSLKILHKHMQPQNATCVSTCRRVRTKHGPGVHGPPLWTGSMDHFHGPGPWTPCHGLGPWTVFFYFYKKVLHQVQGHSKTEIVSKKDLTRRCRPMLTIDHKYLVVLT